VLALTLADDVATEPMREQAGPPAARVNQSRRRLQVTPFADLIERRRELEDRGRA